MVQLVANIFLGDLDGYLASCQAHSEGVPRANAKAMFICHDYSSGRLPVLPVPHLRSLMARFVASHVDRCAQSRSFPLKLSSPAPLPLSPGITQTTRK